MFNILALLLLVTVKLISHSQSCVLKACGLKDCTTFLLFESKYATNL